MKTEIEVRNAEIETTRELNADELNAVAGGYAVGGWTMQNLWVQYYWWGTVKVWANEPTPIR